MDRRRWWTWGIAVLLCAAPVSASTDADSPRAHEFAYPDINPASPSHGKTLALAELYAGRGIVLNFLASWCKFCWEELPSLQELDDAGTAEVVGIAADEYGTPDDLVRLLGQTHATIPVLLVPHDDIEAMEQAYRHGMLPATYLIDREGRIRSLFQGLAKHDVLVREIHEFLGPPPSAVAPPAGAPASSVD